MLDRRFVCSSCPRGHALGVSWSGNTGVPRWLARLRLYIAMRRVVPGWTVVLVPIPIVAVLALGSYSGGALPWLNARFSLGWFDVLALPIAIFAGAYAATEAPHPLDSQPHKRPIIRRVGGARLLALSLLFYSVYLLNVLAGYIRDPTAARRVQEATWWAIPFALCFWTLAAIEFANETDGAGSGEPADPNRQWPWFVALRRSRSARTVGYIVLFGGTIAFAAAGSVPGVVWSSTTDRGVPAWRGHGFKTTLVYNGGFAIWASALLLAACAFLAHSFRARPAGLPDAVLRRAWYSLWAAGALVVLTLFFEISARGWLAEPLIDVGLALYMLCFVVLLVEASLVTKHRRVKSSLVRRVVHASGIIIFGFAIAVITEPGIQIFRAGLLAALVAGAVPLFPVSHRGLFGWERQAAPDPAVESEPGSDWQIVAVPADGEERNALDALLVKGAAQADISSVTARTLEHWRRILPQMRAVPPPVSHNVPRHPFVRVLFASDDGLERTKNFGVPEEMVGLLEALFPGDADEQKWAFIDLLRRTARELKNRNEDKIYKRPPSAMEMLEAESVARLPLQPADLSERREWELLRDMRREWLFGEAVWTGVSQEVERSKHQNTYRDNRGTIRSHRTTTACNTVLRWWLANIEQALSLHQAEQ